MANVAVMPLLSLLVLLHPGLGSMQADFQGNRPQEPKLRREAPGSSSNFPQNNRGESPHRAAAGKPQSLAQTGWSFGQNGYQHRGAYWGHPTPTHWDRIQQRTGSAGAWPFVQPNQNQPTNWQSTPGNWKHLPRQNQGHASTFSMMEQESREAPNRWQQSQQPRRGESIPQWYPFHRSPQDKQMERARMQMPRNPLERQHSPKWPSNADPSRWRHGEFNLKGFGLQAPDALLQDGSRREPTNEHPGPALSAYESDPNDPYKEWFGPFLIDYSRHSLLTDWNVVVNSPEETNGRGNLVVGEQNFIADATNSFISGHHNTARGKDISVVGGEDNVAEGLASTTVGGKFVVARGNFSVGDGGESNQADGNFVVTAGGRQDRSLGEFSTAGGGESNMADGKATTITGGRSNEATGDASAVHGGSGNKALQAMSAVSGGLGQSTIGEGDHIFKVLTAADKEALASGGEEE